ncbi:hypothetical protein B0H63DRAFT_502279 [Podospora didyma]|uniref:Uncharacterized protein n=1 Tax=Podospora didyma TaxID=330526 RepID=A0AAE0KJA4_9PEZI|nr:hypothetical protein B0H63DRAFT_502279 [Podospora didyma]
MSTPDSDPTAEVRKLSIDSLDADHRDAILQAISNILSTEIAEATYAEVVDGLPTANTINEIYLLMGPASPGSRAFKTRLIEIVADTSRHKDDGIVSWIPPKYYDSWSRLHPDAGPRPTRFVHEWFTNYPHYPKGVADMVGYWAEARILGGVVTFDRQSPESDDVYLHPDRNEVTYRICLLLDSPKQDLLNFLLSKSLDSTAPIPIPIRPGRENDQRVDPEEPIALTGIYRDIWERTRRPKECGDARVVVRWVGFAA